MNEADKYYTASAMIKYGGGFVSSLGVALFHADPVNSQRLVEAFKDLLEPYLPGGSYYNAVLPKGKKQ